MSLWQRKALCIAVDDQACVALLRSSRHEPAQWLGVHEGPWRETLPVALAAWAEAADRAKEIRVVAVGRLAQHWVCAAPEGIASLGELHAYAEVRRTQQFGDSVSEPWLVQGDWHARRSFVCAAVPLALKDTVQDWAATRGRPWHLTTDLTDIMGWSLVRAQRTGWVCVDTPAASSLWMIDSHQGPQHLRTWAQSPGQDRVRRMGGIVDELGRAALRAGVDVPDRWCLIQWREARLQATLMDQSAHPIESLADRMLPLPAVDAAHQWLAALACHGDLA